MSSTTTTVRVVVFVLRSVLAVTLRWFQRRSSLFVPSSGSGGDACLNPTLNSNLKGFLPYLKRAQARFFIAAHQLARKSTRTVRLTELNPKRVFDKLSSDQSQILTVPGINPPIYQAMCYANFSIIASSSTELTFACTIKLILA